MKKLMKCFLCFGVVVVVSGIAGNAYGIEILSDNELALVKGSSGFFQTCGNSTSCPTGASCSGITCTSYYVNGFPDGCHGTGGTSGCNSSGNYLKCKWAWCLWCSQGGSDRCGIYKYPICEQVAFACTGTCFVVGSSVCRNDCS